MIKMYKAPRIILQQMQFIEICLENMELLKKPKDLQYQKKHQQNRTTSNFMTLPVFKPIS